MELLVRILLQMIINCCEKFTNRTNLKALQGDVVAKAIFSRVRLQHLCVGRGIIRELMSGRIAQRRKTLHEHLSLNLLDFKWSAHSSNLRCMRATEDLFERCVWDSWTKHDYFRHDWPRWAFFGEIIGATDQICVNELLRFCQFKKVMRI